jgi:hypothetical protein
LKSSLLCLKHFTQEEYTKEHIDEEVEVLHHE